MSDIDPETFRKVKALWDAECARVRKEMDDFMRELFPQDYPQEAQHE